MAKGDTTPQAYFFRVEAHFGGPAPDLYLIPSWVHPVGGILNPKGDNRISFEMCLGYKQA